MDEQKISQYHYNELDLLLISGDFLRSPIPPQWKWLKKYARSFIQRKMLSYYLLFNDLLKVFGVVNFCRLFIEHTGNYCSKSFFFGYVRKIETLIYIENVSKKERDLETISLLKKGNIKGCLLKEWKLKLQNDKKYL